MKKLFMMFMGSMLLASTVNIQASNCCCRQLVNSTSRLENTTALIQGKVCSIQKNVATIKDEGCDFLIRQTDIPKTITTPGLYCLAENVKANGNCVAMIDVQTDCVVLELNDHTVDGNNMASTGIKVGGTGDTFNIIVRNGLVTNATGDGVELEDVMDGVVDKLASRDNAANGFDIVGSSTRVIFRECQASLNDEDGFRFRSDTDNCCLLSCKSYTNGGAASRGFGFCLEGCQHVVRDCMANDNTLEGFQLFGSLDGSSVIFGYHAVRDSSAAGNGSHGFDIKNLRSNAIRDCVSINNVLDGFKVGGGNNTVRDCTAIENGSEGFRLANEGGAGKDENNVVRGCNAVNNGAFGFCIESKSNMIRECAANENGLEGFQLFGALSAPGSPIFGNNVVRDCSASKNASHGFDVKNSSQNELRDCVAIENTNNGFKLAGQGNTVRGSTATGNSSEGFQIAAAGGSGKDENNAIRDCTAARNGVCGFEADTQNNMIRDCMAEGNGSIGFRIDATGNRVLSCMAKDNTTSDYGGTTGVIAGLIASGDANIPTAENQWINTAG